MKEYHKIQSVYKRDPKTNFKTLLGEFSLPEFEFLQHNRWDFTEKVDGTNIRILFRDGQLSFGGRSDRAQLPKPLLAFLERHFQPQLSRFTKNFEEVCFYGEGYGPGIQSGGNYRSDQSFVLFDVKVGDWWLLREDVESIAQDFGLQVVPTFGSGTLHDMVALCQKGFDSTWGSFQAEGLIARPPVELKDRRGMRIITKLKCKDFRS